jgi:hypothetical protein
MPKDTVCEVDACNKPARSRNWCVAHYKRWLRHGDPLGGRRRKTEEELREYNRHRMREYRRNHSEQLKTPEKKPYATFGWLARAQKRRASELPAGIYAAETG